MNALDRLHTHAGREHIYAHIARWMLRHRQPVIVIDWPDVKEDRSWQLQRAAIPVGGRSLPILDMVFPHGKQGSPKAEKHHSATSVAAPENARPILVADAGFRSPWFRTVDAMGWLGRR